MRVLMIVLALMLAGCSGADGPADSGAADVPDGSAAVPDGNVSVAVEPVARILEPFTTDCNVSGPDVATPAVIGEASSAVCTIDDSPTDHFGAILVEVRWSGDVAMQTVQGTVKHEDCSPDNQAMCDFGQQDDDTGAFSIEVSAGEISVEEAPGLGMRFQASPGTMPAFTVKLTFFPDGVDDGFTAF